MFASCELTEMRGHGEWWETSPLRGKRAVIMQDSYEKNTPYLPLSLARASISSKKTMEGATALAFRNTCEQRRQQWKRGRERKTGQTCESVTGRRAHKHAEETLINATVTSQLSLSLQSPVMLADSNMFPSLNAHTSLTARSDSPTYLLSNSGP